MGKIKWTNGHLNKKDKVALIRGGMILSCDYEDGKWCSSARLDSILRMGVWFDLIQEAQKDCMILAQQILTDHHFCLRKLMKQLGVACGDN